MIEWGGDEWEKYCLMLLRAHYGADQVQAVPARHRGDLGLEAFTHTGCALQCYVVEEPVPVEERYQKQVKKLTTALKKLSTNSVELKKLLGLVRIRKYLFMVPIHDSRMIIQHANTKADEIRGMSLSYIDPRFHIVVVTDDAFATERQQVLKRPNALVPVEEATSDELQSWMTDNEGAIAMAAEKLSALWSGQRRRQAVLSSLVRHYIEGENALSAIRLKYPDEWERFARYKTRKENRLVLQYPSPSADANALQIIEKDVCNDLAEQVPNMDSELRTTLAWASIADWLMRCPLDFGEEVA